MSRELTRAEKAMLAVIAEETPAALRTAVDQLVPPKGMVSAGASITSTAAVSDTAVRIPDEYLGKEYPGQKGLFAGYYSDIEDGKQYPLFFLGINEVNNFNNTVLVTSRLENGYAADLLTYDAKKGLREGKDVIADYGMTRTIFDNRNKGKLQKALKNLGWTLTSSPHPGSPSVVRVVGFRGGDDYWGYKDYVRAPSLRVRTARELAI